METTTISKICSFCGKEKPLAEFHKHGKTADGYGCECRDCRDKRRSGGFSKGKRRIEPIYHEELRDFAPRMLMEHLSAIGYKGDLTIPYTIQL